MKKTKQHIITKFFYVLSAWFLTLCTTSNAQDIERVDLWNNLAPSELVREANVENPTGYADKVTTPYLLIYRPAKQVSDVGLLLFPGGGFCNCYYGPEGIPNAEWWNSKGYFAAVLVYRVPRPEGKPIYWKALQDAQRAIRYLKVNASKYGLNPNKIGVQGYSAGGCLALYAASCSLTQTYEPVDDLDTVSPSVAFSIPIYPAFVLDDGATDQNVNGGEGASILPDFKFDVQTPPMCLLHGDADVYSPLGSIEVYKKMRSLNIPCELHIFSGAVHGFYNWFPNENTCDWRERCLAWLKTMGY